MLRSLLGALAAFLTATSVHAQGQTAEWPSKPITIVVPFAAGGPTDKVARDLAEALRKPLGATLVIENVPFMLQLGGGGAIRAIIDELEQRKYRWAYRVVDSYGFGLAQRRERVFLVASRVLDPARVLFGDDQ